MGPFFDGLGEGVAEGVRQKGVVIVGDAPADGRADEAGFAGAQREGRAERPVRRRLAGMSLARRRESQLGFDDDRIALVRNRCTA